MSKREFNKPAKAMTIWNQIMLILDRNKKNEEFLKLLLMRAKSLERLLK